ncbi:MAG: exonuclease SbcCD subunit D [Defluviitaleaceae bacterium]|nr:exonuclease SbcCD subunit D [Defluviitaleaceae bacterium]MCL2273983.1 exonuclease SbcCD subunit D [Defluviitaleaceae bacterium]
MKILHLSDLHIGKSVNGFSMIAEQKHAFAQVVEHIKTECPDAVVIAGDVYDRAVPSVESVRLFDDFLTDLAKTDVAVLLVSGNHDSPERLGYAGRLLTEKRLHLCGMFGGFLHKVVLNDEHGVVNFWLLPFIKPSSLRGLYEEREVESYDGAISAVIESANIDYSERNILIAHQFFTKFGVTPIRSESEFNPVGGLGAVSAELVERFDYVALGHLHGGQSVGSEHIRYCGSPIKYSFSEWRHEKSATLIKLKEKGSLSISTLPFTPIHDMREIKGEIEKLLSDEISSLADKEDYLRVVLTDEEEIIDPMGKLRSVYPNVMSIGFENSRTNIDISSINADIEAIETLSQYDLFNEFFLEVQGSVMSEEQIVIVRELLERTGEE